LVRAKTLDISTQPGRLLLFEHRHRHQRVSRVHLDGQWCWKCKIVDMAEITLSYLGQAARGTSMAFFILCRGAATGIVALTGYLAKEIWAKGKKFNQEMMGKAVAVGGMAMAAGIAMSPFAKAGPDKLLRLIKKIGPKIVSWLKNNKMAAVAGFITEGINALAAWMVNNSNKKKKGKAIGRR
jgi:hypothetical protein